MTAILEIILIILLILMGVCLFFIWVCGSKDNTIYCYIFEHKDWELWEKIYAHIDDAVFVWHHKFEEPEHANIENCLFSLKFDDEYYELRLWLFDGCVSVFDMNDEGKICLCGFNKYFVKKVRAKLASKAWVVEAVQEQLGEDKGEW